MPKILPQAPVIKTHEILRQTILVALRVRNLNSWLHFKYQWRAQITWTREDPGKEPPYHYGQLLLPDASVSRNESIAPNIHFYSSVTMHAVPESESPWGKISTQALIQLTEGNCPDTSLTSEWLAEHNLYNDPENWSSGEGKGGISLNSSLPRTPLHGWLIFCVFLVL